MLKRGKKQPNRTEQAEATSASNELIRVSQQSLIRLRIAASALKLSSQKIRAQQSGSYLSSFRGRGMEFEESRNYQPGDDVRNMDWKVTARTGTPHTKVFCEERERPIICWTDFREPMHFATRGVFKSVIAAKASAAIGWAANNQGDRLGGLVFSEHQHTELKPQRGKRGVLHLIRQLDQIQAADKNGDEELSAEQALSRLRRVARPGSLIFLISDFRNLGEKAFTHITELARHNDIVMFFIYDQLEKSLPGNGQYTIQHEQEKLSFSSSDSNRENYQQHFLQRHDELLAFARRHRISFIECNTEQEPVSVLIEAFR